MNVRRRSMPAFAFSVPLFALASLTILLSLTGCRKPQARLVAEMGTASVEAPNGLLTALNLRNDGSAEAEDVKVDTVSVAGATLTLPTSLPASLGTISPDGVSVLDADFTAGSFAADTVYVLQVAGSFREHGHTFHFKLEKSLKTPPASGGSRGTLSGTTVTHHVTGAPFPAQPPNFGSEINEPGHGPPIPIGPNHPLTPSKQSEVKPAPHGSGGGGGGGVAIDFPTNSSVGTGTSATAEPSGASGGGVVFETANWWAAYSVAGGPFTQLNPTTIFPNTTDNGFCCDQIVQYVPSIDRFIWVMQYGPTSPAPNPNPKNLPNNGPGLYRVASASPAAIKSSGGTAWDYFDVTSQTVLGNTNLPWFDYPDTSYGNTFFYLSGDDVNNFPDHVVVRIPLSDIVANGTIHLTWTTPGDGSVAWGGHLSQNTGDTVFWAGHDSNGQVRVYHWAEASSDYSWNDVTIGSWPVTNCPKSTNCPNPLTSKTPDGQDWFAWGFPNNSILGLARTTPGRDNKQSLVYLAWTGAIGNGFKQPQVQWIAVDANSFALVSQQQVWNPNYAYGYPAFGVNSNNELGMSLEWGGGGNYENHVAGFWGDYVVYSTTNSSAGSVRFGDYVTIRQNTADTTKFDAFGYGVNQSSPAGNPTSDVHYVVFGR